MPDSAPVITITVYHSINKFSDGYTEFSGENVEAIPTNDGGLVIKNWRTDTERGHSRFAAGHWEYVCVSQPRLT